jgi:hypothetical protein
LNGPELVHLIDGHARRHADQIRETCAALPIQSPKATPRQRRTARAGIKPANANKLFTFKRDRPDLPAEFGSPAAPDRLFDNPELVAIEETRLEDLTRTHLEINTVRMEGSVLQRVHLSDGQFGSVIWKDVRLVGCDLANIRAHRISLIRVELVDCRLTGFRATALDWQDVLVQNSDLSYSQFEDGRFRTRRVQLPGG